MAGANRQDPADGADLSGSRIVDGPGFRIRFDSEPGYLRAHVFDGTDSQQVSIAIWRMLADECRAVGASRLLVLEELLATVDTAEIQPIIDAMVQGELAAVRIAFVELLDDIEGSEYGEILCRERGISIRTFSSEDPARYWLVYGD